jgi:hypothetical protein
VVRAIRTTIHRASRSSRRRAGHRSPQGDAIQSTADVEDPQNQRLPRRDIVWRSSLQGVLGSGATISAALQPGTQPISATVTNRGGKSSTATVDVHVAAIPPVFDAGAAGP